VRALLKHTPRDVVAENPHVPAVEEPALEHEDPERVDLFARGATRAPQRERLRAAAERARAEIGEDLVRERAQLVVLAEEVRLVRRERVDGVLELRVAIGVVT
jgi:hypothetical protein